MPDGSYPLPTAEAIRRPESVERPRMAPLASLPVFFDLCSRRVVLAGSGPAAAWKIELLAATGADVLVLDPESSVEVAHAAGRAGPGRTTVLLRGWDAADLAEAALAVGAIEDEYEARRFAGAARACRTPVNVVDNPSLSDFAFGSIVNRSPLVVAVSTGGAAPVVGQAIRARIEALLPVGIGAWLEAAKTLRPRIKALGLGFRDRRTLWERFAEAALSPRAKAPDAAMLDGLFADAAPQPRSGNDRGSRAEIGTVTLVGAGPGDPSLLTLGAVKALQSADVILYDDLVSSEVLELARREARRVAVGKRGHGPSCAQRDIDHLAIAEAKAGRRVVRLKAGDPLIFGRAGEEMTAFRAAGVPFAVEPGITSAQAAAAALGISLTHREAARRVQLVTGHGRDGRLPADLDWEALADPGATTALYMGRRTLAQFAVEVVARGLPAATPAAAVLDASRASQRIVPGTIADLAQRLAVEPSDAPCIILYGNALGHAEAAVAGSAADRAH